MASMTPERQGPRYQPAEFRQRPRDYDPGLAEEICERVANGETLTSICDNRDMPLPATFLRWTRLDAGLAADYAEAKALQCQIMAEEMADIAGESSHPQTIRNKLDARRWFVERTAPDRYGRSGSGAQQREDDLRRAQTPDHTAEVRRRIDALSARHEEERKEKA